MADAIIFFYFFFTHSPTPAIYPLSLHDALPICAAPDDGEDDDRLGVRQQQHRERRVGAGDEHEDHRVVEPAHELVPPGRPEDRKSTRLNSSHPSISYAVFCLKKKNNEVYTHTCI